ncbi:MAG TPA: patatin-like phospholipase family protein [Acidimicrobiia bacterium]|nr:patatin-like phospholipase family protein [Acidimicrobiia bacterium]
MKLRIALTISGAVALGAYEGGALAALLCAIKELCGGDDPAVRVDAIGGASAGSITGLLAARCLLEGIDPVYVMREAWVERDSLSAMRTDAPDEPLSLDALRRASVDLLDPRDPFGRPARRVGAGQRVPIRMVMALASLRGLEYRVPSLSARRPVRATTSLDWAMFTLSGGQPMRELTEPRHASPTDVALASAANALAFRPMLLDRGRDEDGYRARGIVNFPTSKQLWYTDGGILDSEPLTRTLDLVREVDRDSSPDVRRIQVLVHPNPTGAPTGTAWADPQNPPTWLATLLRARDLQRTQSVYDDLLHLEQINTRLDWTGRLFEEIGPVLDDLDADTGARLRDALMRASGVIEGQRRALRAHEKDPAAAAPEPIADKPTTELLRDVVAEIAGIAGKERIMLEVVSPLLLPEAKATPVVQMLAGEFLFHFGGFLSRELRTSDFDLGYRSTLEWLRAGALSESGLSAEIEEQAIARAEEEHRPGDQWRRSGRAAFQDLAARERLALLSVFAHISRVVAHDLRHRRPQ